MDPSLITEQDSRRRRPRPTVLPLDDPRRSPVTKPEHRRGKQAHNAGKSYPPEVYRAREILRLLDTLPKRGRFWRNGARDRALYTLLWRSGLRIGETLDLEVKDLDLERGVVHVLRGKGRKRRPVTIDRRAEAVLVEWLEVRAELLELRCDPSVASRVHGPLFCVLQGQTIGRKLGDSVVRESLKHWAKKADWQRRATPHQMRHTFATELFFEEGVELGDLMRALGHSHASTTDRYIHDLAPNPRVFRLMRDRAWPDEGLGGHEASPPRAA